MDWHFSNSCPICTTPHWKIWFAHWTRTMCSPASSRRKQEYRQYQRLAHSGDFVTTSTAHVQSFSIGTWQHASNILQYRTSRRQTTVLWWILILTNRTLYKQVIQMTDRVVSIRLILSSLSEEKNPIKHFHFGLSRSRRSTVAVLTKSRTRLSYGLSTTDLQTTSRQSIVCKSLTTIENPSRGWTGSRSIQCTSRSRV